MDLFWPKELLTVFGLTGLLVVGCYSAIQWVRVSRVFGTWACWKRILFYQAALLVVVILVGLAFGFLGLAHVAKDNLGGWLWLFMALIHLGLIRLAHDQSGRERARAAIAERQQA